MQLSCIIYKEEERNFVVIKIPNDFIHTRIKNKKYMAIIKTREILVDMLLDIVPGVYVTYVTMNSNGIKKLITQNINAIFGTMVASLIYYRKFFKTMELNNFNMNPYDPCVSNRMINVSQQLILFHVDDWKLSHKHPKVNDNSIRIICEKNRIIFEYVSGEMQANRGKVQNYLGMKLYYTTVGQPNITMLDYINEIIYAFDKADLTGEFTKSSAAPYIIFKVKEYFEKLNTKQAVEFHNIAVKTLFATNHELPDTCIAISSLTMRVR